MLRKFFYRSLMAACVAGALWTLGGCEDAGKKHETIKAEQYNKWNMTRVAVMYQLAQQQYAVGDYDKCKATLADALALKAPHAPLYTLAAKVDIEKGSLETAAAYLKEAIQIDSAGPEPFYLLGVVYQRWQNAEAACDYYQQAWDRKTAEPLYMLAVVEMKITLGKLDDAEKILQAKLVYFEQSPAVRIALARIAGLKNDHVAACRYYRDAVILLPDDQKVRRSYAEELYFAKKYNDAAAIFEDMRKQADTPDRESLVLMLGEAYMQLHRPFDARNCFQELTRNNPSSVQAYLALAKACISTNDLNIAMAAARKVSKLEPGNTQSLILLALVQQKQKKWDDAQGTLEKASTLAPKDSTVLCMLGLNEQQLGRKSDAAACFEKAVELNQNDAWAAELLNKARASAEPPAEPAAVGTAAPADEKQVSAAEAAPTAP